MDTPEMIAAEYLRRDVQIDISSAISRGWVLVMGSGSGPGNGRTEGPVLRVGVGGSWLGELVGEVLGCLPGSTMWRVTRSRRGGRGRG